MENELKKGQVVKVFLDPITCLRKEGTAKLTKFTGRGGVGHPYESWRVRFIDDDFRCDRWINLTNN